MWIYAQDSGKLFLHTEVLDKIELIAIGYSGAGWGKDNPTAAYQHNIGPIPAGLFKIESPRDTVHSPYTLPLTPNPANEMFGRSGFLIHGDSILNPGTASQGCVILPREIRQIIWNSGDHDFQVVHTF
jgi:hypothetical protein